MDQYYVFMIIKSVISVIIALLLGNGAVVWFNNMPVRWFQEEGGILPPSPIADIESERQRLASTPWKLVFTVFFGASGVFLSIRESSQFMIAGMLLIFIVTMMAICDAKYRIIPDQLNVLLAVSAVGFVSFNEKLLEPIYGALIGLSLGLATYGLGRIIYHKTVIGGADLKFYISIGLVTGGHGVVAIFILISIFALIHIVYLSFTKRFDADEHRPMLVYALPAVTLYVLVLWDYLPLVLL
jgi:Type IV leader peptidase family.